MVTPTSQRRGTRLVVGGRWHDGPGFAAALADALFLPGPVEVLALDAELPAALARSGPAELLLVWTCQPEAEDFAPAYDALVAVVAAGTPLVAVHGALSAGVWHAGWRTCLGADFASHPAYGPATWRTDSRAGDRLSPTAWTSADEVYRLDAPPDGEVLAWGEDHQTPSPTPLPAAWIRRHGQGTVAVLTPGHDRPVWLDPGFRSWLADLVRLVRRGCVDEQPDFLETLMNDVKYELELVDCSSHKPLIHIRIEQDCADTILDALWPKENIWSAPGGGSIRIQNQREIVFINEVMSRVGVRLGALSDGHMWMLHVSL